LNKPFRAETNSQHLEGAGLRFTCREIPAKPVEYSIQNVRFPALFKPPYP